MTEVKNHSDVHSSLGRRHQRSKDNLGYNDDDDDNDETDFDSKGIAVAKGRSTEAAQHEKTEIYEAEQQLSSTTASKPWWKASFLLAQPILLGTWDGVFTSCMINMFGVVVFLRMGWMVGNAGVWYSLLIIVMTEVIVVVTILSSLGICQCCHVDSGGVYSLLSSVLGNRIGAAISLVYCFGQAIACSLCAVAFGESIVDLLNMQDNVWVTRAVAAGLLLILIGINVAGIWWIVGFQLVFVVLLFCSVLDFIIGSFARTDPPKGIVGYDWQTFVNNSGPSYEEGETFFTVLGVFFPSVCGAFAGFNMSGDLKDPKTNISAGSLAAVALCTGIYIAFAVILSATCLRTNLQTDFMIAEKISATRILWIIGFYEISLSAAAGNISGPPHVIQAIAADHACSVLEPLAEGRGPNRVPVFATLLFAVISLAFVFVGQLNALGPILTMPFLLSYSAVSYAHFILKTTLLRKKKKKKRKNTGETEEEEEEEEEEESLNVFKNTYKGYGAIENREHEQRTTDRQIDSTSEREGEGRGEGAGGEGGAEEEREEKSQRDDDLAAAAAAAEDRKSAEAKIQPAKRKSFTFNRWISLIGALVSVVAMFVIQWQYALANVLLAFLLWLLVGKTNACLYPGIGEFSVLKYIHDGCRNLYYRISHKEEKILVAEKRVVVRDINGALFPTEAGEISDANEDFADRERFHQTEILQLETPFPISGDHKKDEGSG